MGNEGRGPVPREKLKSLGVYRPKKCSLVAAGGRFVRLGGGRLPLTSLFPSGIFGRVLGRLLLPSLLRLRRRVGFRLASNQSLLLDLAEGGGKPGEHRGQAASQSRQRA